MSQFLLVLRDDGRWGDGMGPEQIQAAIQKYEEWSRRLEEKGHMRGGQKLADGEGKIIRQKGTGLTVSDGPFAEAKEVVGGFFLIEAPSYEEAVELSKDCPHLAFGSVEVRRVDDLGQS